MNASSPHRRFMHPSWTLIMAAAILQGFASTAIAQTTGHQYDEWHFGYWKSIRFGGGAPTVLTGSKMAAWQGCASICDRVTGELLFYTNGQTVWNRGHAVMSNGELLAGGASAVQAALIVPMPADPRRYYIFTTDETESPFPPNGYHYSIVDMRLDGGRGGVTTKNVQILPDVSEHQTAVRHCNGRDFWVIAHANVGTEFHAFLVGPDGVAGTPVVSAVSALTNGHGHSMGRPPQGAIKASPDGTMIAASFGNRIYELYRFDRRTGRLSDPIRLMNGPGAFYHIGVSFSPDNTKLYFSTDAALDQYSLESGDPATIIASHTVITGSPGSDLALAPDGKIYRVPMFEDGWLSAINEPNRPGAQCGFVVRALQTGGGFAYGLPNNIDALDAGVTPRAASIPRDLVANPGAMVEAPLTLDAPASIPAQRMTIRLRYDSTMLRLVTNDPFFGPTSGALLEGWTMSDVTDRPGLFAATFTPPTGTISIAAREALLRPRFRTFISARNGSAPALASELPFQIELDGACTSTIASPGHVRLELCGLSLRMIEATAAKYAIGGIRPNPFNPTAQIEFSIGLDGPTRVEIFDADGSSVAVLADEHMQPGQYLLTWDAASHPSGLYYCRITSGTWSDVAVMKLLK